MDYSKLPKLSETKPEPAPAEQPVAQLGYGHAQRELSIGAEVWISFAIGALLILLCHRPIEYVLTLSHPENFSGAVTDTNTGAPISYPSSIYFLPDLGVCVFGFVLLLDGFQMLFARSLGFAITALTITTGATILNLVAIISAYQNNMGLQLLCFVAVVVGAYTAIYQLNAVRRLRAWKKLKTN